MFSSQGVSASFRIHASPQLPSSQSRNPPILPPSLQLTRFPSPKNVTSTPALSFVLSKLLPLFSVVQLSLEALNNDRFVPESNGEDLSSGYLQVPAGSVMLFTENGVREGNIVEKGMLVSILTSSTQPLVASGVCSLKDVQDAMSNQNLRYAFPFSQFSFNTEIGFILLAEGRRSPFFMVGPPHGRTHPTVSLTLALQTDISLPLQPQSKDTVPLYKSESEIRMPDQEKLDAFRNLLASARRREKLRVSQQLAEVRRVGQMVRISLHRNPQLIEHEFVEERKRDRSVTQHDLTIKMTIARCGILSLALRVSL